MFRNRATSQKPNDELIASFKASFPQVNAVSRPAAVPSQNTASALDLALHGHFGDTDDLKDQDPTPRGCNEPWRFTPSLMDPNSFAFASFANQPPGYYTPTPGGTNTLYHSQAGDLHTPGFSMGLGTPLSMPTSEGLSGQTSGAMHGFQPHAIASVQFQNPNPFALPPQLAQHQSFAPHHFTHQPSTFEPMAQPQEESALDNMPVDIEMQEQSPVMGYAPSYGGQHVRPPPAQQNVNFRWLVTLNAPTAMIKHADEVPVTYLNKGQAYSISIVDTSPAPQIPGAHLKYRTYIRISFEDEQQRQRPAACWQLWKEGRGTNEAHQRGGRLQAVEFVDPTQVGGGDGSTRPRVELESASFDGFAVTWTPSANGGLECSLAVRFNFLSTDFSHSKGVKGIPVRLCAKTEALSGEAPALSEAPSPEICYCKVKLFRDHGAERKLSNDVTHVKKTIDKLKQQIAQAESGMKDFGKRKRGSIAKPSVNNDRPGKVPKHKRTWSMSSASSTGNRPAAEEDLHLKLATLQDMFTSTRPTSVLYLTGEDMDDPDAHPVHLSGEPQDLTKIDTNDTTMWERQSVHTNPTSSVVSPTPSSQSHHSGDRRGSTFQSFPPPSRMSSNEWRSMSQTAMGDLAVQPTAGSNAPVKVQRSSSDRQGRLTGWIEALGVDYSYQPPPERTIKPIACFYAQPRFAGRPSEDDYYRAVYLMQRTLKDLVNAISMKCNIEPTRVVRTLRVNTKGLSILLDDEAVQELPEGQDFIAEFQEITSQSPMKREWDAGPSDIQVDGEVGAAETTSTSGYELRLLF